MIIKYHIKTWMSVLGSSFVLLCPNTHASTIIKYGSYTSYQVNTDANKQNIKGDRGNEPSIAINPTNSKNMVIGWRRFPAPAKSGPQGGFAYSFDQGKTWTSGFLPSLAAQNRTDPALDTDAEGNFYYQSMAHGAVNSSAVFKSSNGGVSWGRPVHQFIGDKNWIAIDKTGGDSQGHIYSTWRRSGSSHPDPEYVPKYFIRSVDGGKTYQEPDAALPIARMGFGRIAIGPQGDVYLSGVDEDVASVNSIGLIRNGHYFLKSTNAKDPTASPTFSATQVDMGGNVIWLFNLDGPNHLGADGDMQIATDVSNSLLKGNIYMLANTQSYLWESGDDPIDVSFVRSEDGGDTWSAPIKLNTDAPSAHSYQYFPMLSVAPNSRIDAVWYDTRNGALLPPYNMSQLYYSYSWDGGETWSENTPVTPLFNTHTPSRIVNNKEYQGDKLGDYTHMLSDINGAHIAYTATFNGEQDIYYLNLFPDCNNNAISDVLDISLGSSNDQDSNHIPDECEQEILLGDVDKDGDVDRDDMRLILSARNQPASSDDDPKDLDGDGRITALDARKIRHLCTRNRCAVK